MKLPYQIHLNFAPVISAIPSFTIYRRSRTYPQEARPGASVTAHKLPKRMGDNTGWLSYWVSTTAVPDFEPFTVTADANRDLTRRMLFLALRESAETRLRPSEFRVPDNEFIEEVHFVMAKHREGEELLVTQPYFLKAIHQFGFLVD